MLKATGALVKHLQSQRAKKRKSAPAPNLLADADAAAADAADPEPIWLTLTTKTHIVDQKRLKPGKIPLPHSLNRAASATILVVVPDPQRLYKDVLAHASFPRALAAQIRVLGVAKLKARYQSFESRRRLFAEYDVFLADDRVIPLLPKLLGKIVYESPKRPVPVSLMGSQPRDGAGKRVTGPKKPKAEPVASPAAVARELAKALDSARVHLSPSVTTSVKIGFADFAPAELAANAAAVVEGMQAKFIPKGWRNIRAVHVKAPNSAALPVWQAPELWVDEAQVLEDAQAAAAKRVEGTKGKKRKRKEGEPEGAEQPKKQKKTGGVSGEGYSTEMAERREKLRAQKKAALAEIEESVGGAAKKAEKGQEVAASA